MNTDRQIKIIFQNDGKKLNDILRQILISKAR